MKKYPIKAKLRCPTCNGNGYVVLSSEFIPNIGKGSERSKRIRNEIRKNKERFSKMTLRAIADELNLNHPQSVKHHYTVVDRIGWDIEE